jgi:hypothetical protein
MGTEKISKKLCSCSQVEIRCSSENLKTLKDHKVFKEKLSTNLNEIQRNFEMIARKRGCNGSNLNGNWKNGENEMKIGK